MYCSRRLYLLLLFSSSSLFNFYPYPAVTIYKAYRSGKSKRQYTLSGESWIRRCYKLFSCYDGSDEETILKKRHDREKEWRTKPFNRQQAVKFVFQHYALIESRILELETWRLIQQERPLSELMPRLQNQEKFRRRMVSRKQYFTIEEAIEFVNEVTNQLYDRLLLLEKWLGIPEERPFNKLGRRVLLLDDYKQQSERYMAEVRMRQGSEKVEGKT